MKALLIAIASVGLLTACSGGTAPVEVSQPGPSDSPAPSPGGGAEKILAPPGGSLSEQAVEKLAGECRIVAEAQASPRAGVASRRVGSDMLSECDALCVLDSSCDEIARRNEEHNVYRACIDSCSP
jgi:hypothetical protein